MAEKIRKFSVAGNSETPNEENGKLSLVLFQVPGEG